MKGAESMKAYIEKKPNINWNYLLTWQDPETGYTFTDTFKTLKEATEYAAAILAEVVTVNF